MKSSVVDLAVTGIVALVLAAPAFGQHAPAPADKTPTAEKPLTLEEMLTQALKDNPDLRMAEIKVREAEEELKRTRLQVLQKVASHHAALLAARMTVQEAEDRYRRVAQLRERQAVSQEEVQAAQLTMARFKAEMAKLEAETPYLLGQLDRVPFWRSLAFTPDGRQLAVQGTDGAVRIWDLAKGQAVIKVHPTATTAENLRKLFDTPLKADIDDVPLKDVLEYLKDMAPGLVIRSVLPADESHKVDLNFKEPIPLKAILQAIEDSFPAGHPWHGLRFIVREYGLLVALEKSMPPGALTLQEFLRSEPAGALWSPATGANSAPPERNPAPDGVEGVILQTDPSGLVTVSIGEKAGLAKGHTLEVFRLNPPKYLGTIRIQEVTAERAVGKPVGQLKEPIKMGDRVASKIPSARK